MSFKNGMKKAITFSFDDGNFDDIKLVEILNKYNLKSTFNLSSGILDDSFVWKHKGIKDVHHLNFTEHKNLYDGHEVASHTVRHAHLEELDSITVKNEIWLDCIYLKALYGYDICGMALPFGTYNQQVIDVVKKLGLKYCRTVDSTGKFDMPTNLPIINPTCHFLSDNINKLIEEFFSTESDKDMLFYIWGHSYELITKEDWNNFEKLCKKLAGKPDVFYGTNKEIFL